MPRTAIAIQTPPGGDASPSADLTWVAADAVNNNLVAYNSRGILLARNDNAGAQDVVVQSVATSVSGRVLDTTSETKSIAAGEYAIFGPFPADGWKDTTEVSTGAVHIDCGSADVKFAYVIPAA